MAHQPKASESAGSNRAQRRAAARNKAAPTNHHGPNLDAVGAGSKKFATKSKANSRKFTIRKV